MCGPEEHCVHAIRCSILSRRVIVLSLRAPGAKPKLPTLCRDCEHAIVLGSDGGLTRAIRFGE